MKPKFIITKRMGKNSLWVNDYNIWDLTDEELTENVKNAILHAYNLGQLHAKKEFLAMVNAIEVINSTTAEFKILKKKK